MKKLLFCFYSSHFYHQNWIFFFLLCSSLSLGSFLQLFSASYLYFTYFPDFLVLILSWAPILHTLVFFSKIVQRVFIFGSLWFNSIFVPLCSFCQISKSFSNCLSSFWEEEGEVWRRKEWRKEGEIYWDLAMRLYTGICQNFVNQLLVNVYFSKQSFQISSPSRSKFILNFSFYRFQNYLFILLLLIGRPLSMVFTFLDWLIFCLSKLICVCVIVFVTVYQFLDVFCTLW